LFFCDSEKYRANPINSGCIKFKCGTRVFKEDKNVTDG